MRALFHMRPPTDAELRVREVCGFCCLRWCVDCGRATPEATPGGAYAPRMTRLLRIGSDSRATVYKPHQQNDVDGLNHDDEQ